MNKKLEDFEKVLSNKYDNDSFVGFVKEFFNDVKLVAPTFFNTNVGSNFFYYVQGYYHIGN